MSPLGQGTGGGDRPPSARGGARSAGTEAPGSPGGIPAEGGGGGHPSEPLPEGVGLLMPAQLSPDTVGDGGDELPAQPQLGAQLQGELLR